MKTINSLLVVLVLTILGSSTQAQTKTITDLRVGIQGQATYHLAEVFQVRGRWIVPDIGYVDFADTSNYREWFVGGGYKVIDRKKFSLIEEVYFVQTDGPASQNARYLQLWTGIFFNLNSKISGEAAIFPYIPLNDAGTKQWVVERVKMEYAVSPALKVGGGYGAYQFGDEKWQHKPFVTTTLTPSSGKFGSLELWYQRMPRGGGQVQIRYELVR